MESGAGGLTGSLKYSNGTSSGFGSRLTGLTSSGGSYSTDMMGAAGCLDPTSIELASKAASDSELLTAEEKENSDKRNVTKLNNYYESLRTNVMSILGQVREPSLPPPVQAQGGMPVNSSSVATTQASIANQEHFDSYLTKLQTICSESMSTDEHGLVTSAPVNSKPAVYDSVKSALQNFNALSTRI